MEYLGAELYKTFAIALSDVQAGNFFSQTVLVFYIPFFILLVLVCAFVVPGTTGDTKRD